jgi:hypothetical protein
MKSRGQELHASTNSAKPAGAYRVLHTADWPLGKMLGEHSREVERFPATRSSNVGISLWDNYFDVEGNDAVAQQQIGVVTGRD